MTGLEKVSNSGLLAEVKRRIELESLEAVLFDFATGRLHHLGANDNPRQLPKRLLLNVMFPFVEHDDDSRSQSIAVELFRELADEQFRALRSTAMLSTLSLAEFIDAHFSGDGDNPEDE
nr:hypothetical protein [uncultured Shimia sp.]